MDNNFISFLYLFLLLFVLTPICFIVTIQIFQLLFNYAIFRGILLKQNSRDVDISQILSLAKIYISRKKWFTCILMLEAEIHIHDDPRYYNCIGFCYYNMKWNNLAKLYYLKALDKSPKYIIALSNLAKVYHLMEDEEKATELYQKIILLDNNNKVAKRFLNL